MTDRPIADSMSTSEFAALCRERCKHTAQGHDDLPCGGVYLSDEGTAYGFCGWHWISRVWVDR